MRECIVRAIRTFLQTALGYAAASLTGLVQAGDSVTSSALAGLLAASVAAGVAAIMNLPDRSENRDSDPRAAAEAEANPEHAAPTPEHAAPTPENAAPTPEHTAPTPEHGKEDGRE